MADHVASAIERFKREGTRGIDWEFSWCMMQGERDAFDRMLLATKHPLAYIAGTAESRFRQYVIEQATRDRTKGGQ